MARLRSFHAIKFFYYLHSALNLRKNLMAWKERKRAIREPDAGATAT